MVREISTLIPGPDNQILDAWVAMGGVRVTTVPIGESFTIHCKYQAHNAISMTFTDYTKTTITVSGEGIKRYEDTIMIFIKQEVTVEVGKFRKATPSPPIMPSGTGPLILVFRLWLHDNAYIDPPYPPEDQW